MEIVEPVFYVKDNLSKRKIPFEAGMEKEAFRNIMQKNMEHLYFCSSFASRPLHARVALKSATRPEYDSARFITF